MRRRTAALLASWLSLALGCETEADRIIARVERARSTEEAPTAIAELPPLPGTIEECTAALSERTAAELRATLDDLAYDTVYRDACTAARAEADRSPSLCDDLSVTVLRDRCHERVAIAVGDADACPDARAGDGREPLCLALARRDARLCAAAGTLDRAVCEAVLTDGDDHRGRSCGRLPTELQPACTARSERLMHLATGDRVEREQLDASLTFRIGEEPEHAVGSASRGARIVYEACIPTLVVGEARAPGLSLHGPGTLLLRVPLGGNAPFEAAIGALSGSLEISTAELRPTTAETGHVSIDVLERDLGGEVRGSFSAELRAGATPQHVEGAFTTFVRDLEPRPESCPAP